jgi:hypothetical protein
MKLEPSKPEGNFARPFLLKLDELGELGAPWDGSFSKPSILHHIS